MSILGLNITGLAPGQEYEVEVAYASPLRETSEFTALGSVTTGDLVPQTAKVTDAAKVFLPSVGAIANDTAPLLASLTLDTQGEAIDITVSTDVKVSSGDEFDLLVYVDSTYTFGGTSPTFASPADGRKSQIRTGLGSDFKVPAHFKHAIGTDAVDNPPLAAGTHTFNLYGRNNTNQGVELDDLYFEVRRQSNDTPV